MLRALQEFPHAHCAKNFFGRRLIAGAAELLGPVNARLQALDQYPQTLARYAEVAIRAAVSAARDRNWASAKSAAFASVAASNSRPCDARCSG